MFTTEEITRITKRFRELPPGMDSLFGYPTVEVIPGGAGHLLFVHWQPGDGTRYRFQAWRDKYPMYYGRVEVTAVMAKVGDASFHLIIHPGGSLDKTYVLEKGFGPGEPTKYNLTLMTYVAGILTGRHTDVDFRAL